MAKNALLILAQGNEEIEALTVVDILRRGGVDVLIAGLGGRTIASARNVVVLADTSLEMIPADREFDAVILPGGNPGSKNLSSSTSVLDMVKKQFDSGRLLAAICAAPTVLDKAGVLAGRSYTCYPGVEKEIISGSWIGGGLVVDANIITGRAMGSAIEFSLAILEYLTCKEDMERVANAIVFR